MSTFQGFFQLQSSRDLLRKMEHDFSRMQAEPLNPYPAFDFFVAGEHMLDWVYPGDEGRRRQERLGSVVLQICSHLANGSKHFRATQKHHKSVQSAHARPAARIGELMIGVSRIGMDEGLEITLAQDEADQLGSGGWIDAIDLAQLVLDFWRNHPDLK
jgi:hypothetical protein